MLSFIANRVTRRAGLLAMAIGIALLHGYAQAESEVAANASTVPAMAQAIATTVPTPGQLPQSFASPGVCKICPQGYHCHCDPKTGTCWCIVKQPK